MGEDYQETFEQQSREIAERKAKGLPPPSWITSLQLAPEQQEVELNSETKQLSPHFKSGVLNKTLFIEPTYASTFFSYLGSRAGASKLTDSRGRIILFRWKN